MNKWAILVGGVMFTVVVFTGLAAVSSADEPIPIAKVMKDAMKGGLCKKVIEGQASDAEKKELLVLFQGLAKATPPQGEAASWKTKTTALVEGAQAAVDGKDASAMLKQAANCKACHDVHKGQ